MRVITNNGSKLSAIYCLLFVLLFYFNNETLPNNLSTIVSQPTMYVAILELVVFVFASKSRINSSQVSGSALIVAISLIFFVIMGGLVDERFANGYFLLIMNILVALTMSSLIPYKLFAKFFVQLVVFFAIASLLITYAFKPFLGSLPLPHVYNSVFVPFINAYLCYLVDIDGYLRNTGIFREAGVWGGFLCIAIILLVTNRDLFKKKTLIYFYIILIVTILSTFSTTCLIAGGLIYGVFIFKKTGNTRQNIALILILAAVFIILSRYSLFIEQFDESVGKLSTESSSYQVRTEIMKNSISIIFSNPFGLGILRGTQALTSVNTLGNYHNTNTFVAGGVYFGLIFLAIYVVGLFIFCEKRLGNWLYLIPLALLMSGEQYIFNPWFFMLLFYGCKSEIGQVKKGMPSII